MRVGCTGQNNYLMGGLNPKETALVAISMNGRGAVELIIASVGIELGIINDVYFSILVVMAFITIRIPLVAMRLYSTVMVTGGCKNWIKMTDPVEEICCENPCCPDRPDHDL